MNMIEYVVINNINIRIFILIICKVNFHKINKYWYA